MTCDDILYCFDGNKTRAAAALRVSRPTIYKWSEMDFLPEEAMMHMREWFLRTTGKIPKQWMPEREVVVT